MSDENIEDLKMELTKEAQVLRSVKKIVTNVIKETATKPGLKHPLSDGTIADMRECLLLISNREQELAKALDKPMTMRPVFSDDPKAQKEVVVQLRPRDKK